ncbi:hypothetical protein [Natrialba sp. INN-245]|uniref:hypothetical protein n=1 Tax=Natrialba sp. INN-245 TaxID=2690967 RepID=UPI0013139960|nr:hypothetical protein [Natrialba sp. INN-245]MWV40220.1 hypothetical protein [Natrialba sp. INN-245]
MPSRRTIVASCCAVAIAGCLDEDGPGSKDEPTDGDDISDTDPNDSDDFSNDSGGSSNDADNADDSPNDVSEPTYRTLEEERKRGQAEAISASKSEWDRWVKYQPDDDEVQYVTAKGPSRNVDPDEYDQEPPDRDLEFGTTPWDRWKHIRANDVAGEAALKAVTTELGTEYVGRPIAVSEDPADRQTVVRVETIVDGDGNVIEGESTDIDAVAAATPESVDVTYELDERSFETTREVFAEYRKTRLE